MLLFFFFFFQAEDGIRDKLVTGVQTCALPIHLRRARECLEAVDATEEMAALLNTQGRLEAQLGRHAEASRAYREALAWVQRVSRDAGRSEERRVGEECRSRWSPDH